MHHNRISPHISRLKCACIASKYLGGDVRRRATPPLIDAFAARETKICELDDVERCIGEDVLRLDVTMDDGASVEKYESGRDTVYNTAGLGWREGASCYVDRPVDASVELLQHNAQRVHGDAHQENNVLQPHSHAMSAERRKQLKQEGFRA